MSKYLDLAKKLKALADRGEGGEKVNAEKLLQKLLKKHNLTLEDVEGEKRIMYYYTVDNYKLFRQIIANVAGDDWGDIWRIKRRKTNNYKIEIRPDYAIEIEGKYAFYNKLYKEQLETFYLAFVGANELFKNAPPIKEKDLTPEELEQRAKAERMARTIEKGKYLKQLSK